MSVSLQKANFWKRISAYLFDMLLTVMIAVGLATVLSAVFGYDRYSAELDSYYAQYEETYGIDLDITEEEFNLLPQEEQDKYNAADEAFSKDEDVRALYNRIFYLTLAIVGISLLLAHLALYFVVPLCFKNGQTLGKKCFGLAVMRTNCVKVSNPVLFVRSILGLYTIETMVPVLLVTMIYFGVLGGVGTITLLLLLVLQIVVMIVTQTNSSIHDLLSDTVVVDMASQQIFDSEEALIAYKQEQHELEVAAQRERGIEPAQEQQTERNSSD